MVAASISVSSQAFSSGGAIPARYRCSGADVSPSLSWTGVPGGAHSLAIWSLPAARLASPPPLQGLRSGHCDIVARRRIQFLISRRDQGARACDW